MTNIATKVGGGAEERMRELGITRPAPPSPFGSYVETVRTGNLLFLSGMLPTRGHEVAYVGRVGGELSSETGREAAEVAGLNPLAFARELILEVSP